MGERLRLRVLSVLGVLAAGATALGIACGGDDGTVDPSTCEGPTCDGGASFESSTTDSPSGTDGSTASDAGADGDVDSAVAVTCGDGGAPGTLDESFGTGGVVVLPFLGGDATALVAQPDGKVLVVGKSQTDGGVAAFALARLLPNGSLDPAFGSGGMVELNVTGNKPHLLKAVALQPDGRIVAVGYSRPVVGDDFVVTRYLANGTPDTTFGTNGVVFTDFSSLDQANAVAVLADGRVLAAGFTAAGTGDMALARYNTDGSLDTTFGGTGKVTLDVRGTADQARALALVSGGKVVVAGTTRDPNAGRLDVAVARVNSDGALDSTFADGGVFVSSFLSPGSQTGNSIALDATGRAVVGGNYGSASPDDFGVLRLSTAGALDPTFGTNGLATIDFSGRSDIAESMALQEDGKLVVAGSSLSAIATDPRIGVSRHLPGGGLDPSFGGSGLALFTLPAGFSGAGVANAGALSACSFVVAGGWTDPGGTNRMGLMRVRR